jgi:hypothetical protein
MTFKTFKICWSMMAKVFICFPRQTKGKPPNGAEKFTEFRGGGRVGIVGFEKAWGIVSLLGLEGDGNILCNLTPS